MRDTYHESLDQISALLAQMAVQVGAAMNLATEALLTADTVKAHAVIAGDDEIDDLTGIVEERCYAATALHQPVARDLRIVISALQISSSLERMGDLAEHVALRVTMRLPQSSIPDELRATFAEMGALDRAMVTATAAAISTRDISLASDIAAYEDCVDALHQQLFTAVLSPTWTHGVEAAIDATLYSRYYERFADHAVTIARRVVQIVTGDSYANTDIEDATHPPV